MTKFLGFMGLVAVLGSTLCAVSAPSLASGGSGGGGGNGGGGGSAPKVVESRVTGYVTAIDYEHSTITVGASYYGSGVLKVTSTTNISLDNVSCDFSTIKLGAWAEARYDWSTGTATKLTCTTVPTS